MKVKEAKQKIEKINKLCDNIFQFEKTHEELLDETGFMCDAIGYLCDYKKVLEQAIENADLKI